MASANRMPAEEAAAPSNQELPTEEPNVGRLVLSLDPQAGRQRLHHSTTGEVALLPLDDRKPWSLEFDFQTGFGLLRRGGQDVWAAEILKRRFVMDAGAMRSFVVDEEGTMHRWQDYKSSHTRRSLELVVGKDKRAFVVYYVFPKQWVGAFVWWSFASWFRAAAIETAQRPGHWLHNYLSSWEKACERASLPAPHVMPATTKLPAVLPPCAIECCQKRP